MATDRSMDDMEKGELKFKVNKEEVTFKVPKTNEAADRHESGISY